MLAERIGHRTAMRTEGVGERHHHRKCDGRAEPPGVAFGNAGSRQVAVEFPETLGHALLVFAPQRGRERVGAAGNAVGLGRNRGVFEAVVALDAAVYLGRRRPAQIAQGIKGGQPAERERHGGRDTQPVRHEAKQAEPRYGQKQRCDDEDGENQRPAALDHDHRARHEAGARQARRQASTRGVRVGHRSFHIGFLGGIAQQTRQKDSSNRGKGEAVYENVITAVSRRALSLTLHRA